MFSQHWLYNNCLQGIERRGLRSALACR